MACAVILRAIEDSRQGPVTHKPGQQPEMTEEERQEAILFCTSNRKDWKEARAIWCSLADINPDSLREKALAGFPGLR